MARNHYHYHVIRILAHGEEYTATVPTKAQARQAAKNQALLEAHRLNSVPRGSLKVGWIVVPQGPGLIVSYMVERCSQEPCTAVHEDSPSLEGLPLP